MKLAGKVALQKSYQAHKFWYELLPPLKSYFSFTASCSKLKTGSRLVPTRYVANHDRKRHKAARNRCVLHTDTTVCWYMGLYLN